MWTIPGPRQKFGAGQNNNVAPNDAREGVTVLLTTPFANNIRFEVPFRPSVTLVRFANDKRRWMCSPCHSNSRPLVRTSSAPSVRQMFLRTALCWEMRAALARLAQGASFGTTADVWNWYAEGSG